MAEEEAAAASLDTGVAGIATDGNSKPTKRRGPSEKKDESTLCRNLNAHMDVMNGGRFSDKPSVSYAVRTFTGHTFDEEVYSAWNGTGGQVCTTSSTTAYPIVQQAGGNAVVWGVVSITLPKAYVAHRIARDTALENGVGQADQLPVIAASITYPITGDAIYYTATWDPGNFIGKAYEKRVYAEYKSLPELALFETRASQHVVVKNGGRSYARLSWSRGKGRTGEGHDPGISIMFRTTQIRDSVCEADVITPMDDVDVKFLRQYATPGHGKHFASKYAALLDPSTGTEEFREIFEAWEPVRPGGMVTYAVQSAPPRPRAGTYAAAPGGVEAGEVWPPIAPHIAQPPTQPAKKARTAKTAKTAKTAWEASLVLTRDTNTFGIGVGTAVVARFSNQPGHRIDVDWTNEFTLVFYEGDDVTATHTINVTPAERDRQLCIRRPLCMLLHADPLGMYVQLTDPVTAARLSHPEAQNLTTPAQAPARRTEGPAVARHVETRRELKRRSDGPPPTPKDHLAKYTVCVSRFETLTLDGPTLQSVPFGDDEYNLSQYWQLHGPWFYMEKGQDGLEQHVDAAIDSVTRWVSDSVPRERRGTPAPLQIVQAPGYKALFGSQISHYSSEPVAVGDGQVRLVTGFFENPMLFLREAYMYATDVGDGNVAFERKPGSIMGILPFVSKERHDGVQQKHLKVSYAYNYSSTSAPSTIEMDGEVHRFHVPLVTLTITSSNVFVTDGTDATNADYYTVLPIPTSLYPFFSVLMHMQKPKRVVGGGQYMWPSHEMIATEITVAVLAASKSLKVSVPYFNIDWMHEDPSTLVVTHRAHAHCMDVIMQKDPVRDNSGVALVAGLPARVHAYIIGFVYGYAKHNSGKPADNYARRMRATPVATARQDELPKVQNALWNRLVDAAKTRTAGTARRKEDMYFYGNARMWYDVYQDITSEFTHRLVVATFNAQPSVIVGTASVLDDKFRVFLWPDMRNVMPDANAIKDGICDITRWQMLDGDAPIPMATHDIRPLPASIDFFRGRHYTTTLKAHPLIKYINEHMNWIGPFVPLDERSRLVSPAYRGDAVQTITRIAQQMAAARAELIERRIPSYIVRVKYPGLPLRYAMWELARLKADHPQAWEEALGYLTRVHGEDVTRRTAELFAGRAQPAAEEEPYPEIPLVEPPGGLDSSVYSSTDAHRDAAAAQAVAVAAMAYIPTPPASQPAAMPFATPFATPIDGSRHADLSQHAHGLRQEVSRTAVEGATSAQQIQQTPAAGVYGLPTHGWDERDASELFQGGALAPPIHPSYESGGLMNASVSGSALSPGPVGEMGHRAVTHNASMGPPLPVRVGDTASMFPATRGGTMPGPVLPAGLSPGPAYGGGVAPVAHTGNTVPPFPSTWQSTAPGKSVGAGLQSPQAPTHAGGSAYMPLMGIPGSMPFPYNYQPTLPSGFDDTPSLAPAHSSAMPSVQAAQGAGGYPSRAAQAAPVPLSVGFGTPVQSTVRDPVLESEHLASLFSEPASGPR